MTGRTRRPQVPVTQRRAQLVEAAIAVMRREGAWALTTRAVAAEAGVPHGSVHYAFSSKEELLRAVLAADTEAAAVLLTAVGVEGDPGEVLTRAFTAYADRLVADPDTELVLQELSLMGARDPALRPLVREENDAYRAMTARLLEDVASTAGTTWDAPVEIVAEQVLGILFGVAATWLVDRDDDRLRRTLADAARATAARLRTGTGS